MQLQGQQKHEFALFLPNLAELVATKRAGDALRIQDEQVYHRIVHVLRLSPQETIIAFDNHVHVYGTIEALIPKKSVNIIISAVTKNKEQTPHITLCLPLLKREAFEDAVYSAVELGVNTIQLLNTHKGQRSWSGAKDMHRAHNIVIAAAEQSKNFALPIINEPHDVAHAVDTLSKGTFNICFAVQGKPLFEGVTSVREHSPSHITLFVGPEGDFTEHEYALMEKSGMLFCALTPTILRTQQAVAVGVGAVRALLR
jgi:16S rRNA (uracil1498-N3)-methyltransferase